MVMVALSQLSDLLQQIESSVGALTRQEGDLTRTCKTLGARKGFLERTISDLERKQESLLEGNDAKIVEQNKIIADNTSVAEQLKLVTSKLLRDKAVAEAGLAAAQETQSQVTHELQADIDAQRLELATITAQLVEATNESDALQVKIGKQKQRLADLDQQVAECRALVAKETADLELRADAVRKSTRQAEKQLETVNTQVSVAETRRDDAVADTALAQEQYEIFKDREKEIRGTLQARDDSLTAREAKLEEALKRARRNGIMEAADI
jgi:chromosome segregation ATPase